MKDWKTAGEFFDRQSGYALHRFRWAAYAAVALACASTVMAQGTVLRLGHPQLPTSAFHTKAVAFADEVGKRIQGCYKVEVFPSGALDGKREMVEAVQLGALQQGRTDVIRADDYRILSRIRLGAYNCATAAYDGRNDDAVEPVALTAGCDQHLTVDLRHLHCASARCIGISADTGACHGSGGDRSRPLRNGRDFQSDAWYVHAAVGSLLFVTSKLASIPLANLTREVRPFLAMLTFIPGISTWLLRVFGFA